MENKITGMLIPIALMGIALMLWQCAGPVNQVREPVAISDKAEKWQRYGAFYEYNDWLFKVFQKRRNSYVWPGTVIQIKQKIHIISKNGIQYGTVRIGRFEGKISRFKILLKDPDGREISLPVQDLRKAFAKSGNIVFPKVSVGSVIEVDVKIDFDGYYYAFEHWFSGDIPIAAASLTVDIQQKQYRYEFRNYGLTEEPVEQPGSRKSRQIVKWEVKDLLPRNVIDYSNFIDFEEPRVSIAARRIQHYINLSTWEKVGKKYQKYLMKEVFFNSSRELKKTADSLLDLGGAESEKADRMLKWVQENLSMIKGDIHKIDFEKIFETRQGNVWDILAVLHEMLKYGGFKPEILISREKFYGGFDGSFPSWRNLWRPMIRVSLDGVPQMAWPYSNAFKLGELPPGYEGQQALSLEGFKIVDIPQFRQMKSEIEFISKINAGHPSDTIHQTCIYRGYPASEIRSRFYSDKDLKQEAWVDTLLAGIEPVNKRISHKIEGLYGRGEDIEINVDYVNSNLMFSRGKTSQYRFEPMLGEYFDTYDTSRVSTFETRYPLTISHTVQITHPGDHRPETDFTCSNQDNLLFTTLCSLEKSKGTAVYKRILSIKKASLTARQIREIFPEILILNKIRNSSLIIR